MAVGVSITFSHECSVEFFRISTKLSMLAFKIFCRNKNKLPLVELTQMVPVSNAQSNLIPKLLVHYEHLKSLKLGVICFYFSSINVLI